MLIVDSDEEVPSNNADISEEERSRKEDVINQNIKSAAEALAALTKPVDD